MRSDKKTTDHSQPITGQHFSHMTIALQRRRLWQENPGKNQEINNFAAIFEALRNVRNQFNLHHWTALNVIKKMPCCLKGLIHY